MPNDRERPRVLAAIKPGQGVMPLAAERAREVAEGLGGDIMLVSVVFDSLMTRNLGIGAAFESGEPQRLIEGQRRELEKVAESLRASGAAVEVRVAWEQSPFRGILRVAEEWQADLIVIAATERRPLFDPSRTNTHWKLTGASRLPLLLAKKSSAERRPVVLAAIDPSRSDWGDMDQRVLAAAQRFAAALHCSIRVVHVFPDPEKFAIASAVEVSPGVFYGVENIAELHRQKVEELIGGYGIDPANADVLPGEPAEVIAELIAEHDPRLVVLGLSRYSRFEQMVLGSITEAVSVTAPCDVLLIPRPARAGTEEQRDEPGA